MFETETLLFIGMSLEPRTCPWIEQDDRFGPKVRENPASRQQINLRTGKTFDNPASHV